MNKKRFWKAVRLHAFLNALLFLALAGAGCRPDVQTGETKRSPPKSVTPKSVRSVTRAVHVYPGQSIQDALDEAAAKSIAQVVVHAGVYAPPEPRQALVWFNERHNGIHLQANGDVTLTAGNERIANPKHKSYPAIVNHVVYFGDGVGPKTKLSGFTITGANNFVTTKKGPTIEPESEQPRLDKTAFFYMDGGAIKIFGRSYPTLENLTITDNHASPNSGGISIEHRGYTEAMVSIRNCVFRNNRAPLTGAAIALLDHEYGSAALIENCLFVQNLSNCDLDTRSQQLGTWNQRSGHGALTVFAFSRAEVRNCTFVNNRNGIDDLSQHSTFQHCIFWNNQAEGGWPEGDRYDIQSARVEAVQDCFFGSNSLRFDPRRNMLQAPTPEFDEHWIPQNDVYGEVGYRPALPGPSSSEPNPNTTAKGTKTLAIQVDGEKFGWNIRYAGEDQEFGTLDDVVTRRHIYIPSHTQIRLFVGSKDYLYQLALPDQSVKEVAIPNMTQRCSFAVDSPGIYPLVGDQFCGYTHPDLIGKLIVKDPAEFQIWLEKQKP